MPRCPSFDTHHWFWHNRSSAKHTFKTAPTTCEPFTVFKCRSFLEYKKILIFENVECHNIKQLVYMSDLSDFPEASAFVLLDFKGTNTKKHLVSISAELSALRIYLMATNTMKKWERFAVGLAQCQTVNDAASLVLTSLSRWRIGGITCIKSTQQINARNVAKHPYANRDR